MLRPTRFPLAVIVLGAACAGLVLFGTDPDRRVRAGGDPGFAPASVPVAAATQAAVPALASLSHGVTDDQPAGACWIGRVHGALQCLCSAGTVEDLMTLDFMRALLVAWRDAGQLSTAEWRQRLWEVDAACAAPALLP